MSSQKSEAESKIDLLCDEQLRVMVELLQKERSNMKKKKGSDTKILAEVYKHMKLTPKFNLSKEKMTQVWTALKEEAITNREMGLELSDIHTAILNITEEISDDEHGSDVEYIPGESDYEEMYDVAKLKAKLRKRMRSKTKEKLSKICKFVRSKIKHTHQSSSTVESIDLTTSGHQNDSTLSSTKSKSSNESCIIDLTRVETDRAEIICTIPAQNEITNNSQPVVSTSSGKRIAKSQDYISKKKRRNSTVIQADQFESDSDV